MSAPDDENRLGPPPAARSDHDRNERDDHKPEHVRVAFITSPDVQEIRESQSDDDQRSGTEQKLDGSKATDRFHVTL